MSNNGNPRNTWTEDKGIVLDSVVSIEGSQHLFPDDEKMSEHVVKNGALLVSNCPYCSAQVKHIILWGEVACFVLGQPLPGTQPTTSGVYYNVRCGGCQKPTRVLITWPEITRYVDDGVRRQALKRDILDVMHGQKK
jgi:hypothetical protein